MKALLSTLALAPLVALTAAAVPPPTTTCYAVEVSSATATNTAKASTRFSVSRTLDLAFTVLLPRTTSGDHVIELRILTPDRQVYRSMAVPFGDEARPAAARGVSGYPRPVPEKTLARVTRGTATYAAVSVPFPVGGTDIVSSGLYGSWSVQAHMDGAEAPCAPAAVFTLNP